MSTFSDPVSLQSPDDIIEAARKKYLNREVFTFQIPPNATRNGITTIGLVVLTPDEEIMAQRRASTEPVRLAFELAKECLRMVNGKTVSMADGSVERAWEQMGPKARNLVAMAYGSIHQPENGDISTFLQSRQVSVG